MPAPTAAVAPRYTINYTSGSWTPGQGGGDGSSSSSATAAAGGSSKRETIAEKARNARLDAESRSSGLRQRKGARS